MEIGSEEGIEGYRDVLFRQCLDQFVRFLGRIQQWPVDIPRHQECKYSDALEETQFELLEFKPLPKHVFMAKETMETIVKEETEKWKMDITSSYYADKLTRGAIVKGFTDRLVERLVWDITTGILGRLNVQYHGDTQKPIVDSTTKEIADWDRTFE